MIESYKESMMKTRNLVVACCLVGGLAGCANMSSGEQRTLSGAAIGTAAGALVGGLATGRPMTGAAIGAATGAAGGWLYDRHEREDR
jgi:osmotically inducible lipoprotein OsmB